MKRPKIERTCSAYSRLHRYTIDESIACARNQSEPSTYAIATCSRPINIKAQRKSPERPSKRFFSSSWPYRIMKKSEKTKGKPNLPKKQKLVRRRHTSSFCVSAAKSRWIRFGEMNSSWKRTVVANDAVSQPRVTFGRERYHSSGLLMAPRDAVSTTESWRGGQVAARRGGVHVASWYVGCVLRLVCCQSVAAAGRAAAGGRRPVRAPPLLDTVYYRTVPCTRAADLSFCA